MRIGWASTCEVLEARTWNCYCCVSVIAQCSVMDHKVRWTHTPTKHWVWTLFSVPQRGGEPITEEWQGLLGAAPTASCVFPGNSTLAYQLLLVFFLSESLEKTVSPFYYSSRAIQISLGCWQLPAQPLFNLALICHVLPKHTVFY